VSCTEKQPAINHFADCGGTYVERVGHEADRLLEEERKVRTCEGALAESGDDGVSASGVVGPALDTNVHLVGLAVDTRRIGGGPNGMRHFRLSRKPGLF